MQNVWVKMRDELTGENVERKIDISNIMVAAPGGMMQVADVERQKVLLEEWIKDRANDQHNTLLSLICWAVCK